MRHLLPLIITLPFLVSCGARFSCPAPQGGLKCTPITQVYEEVKKSETGVTSPPPEADTSEIVKKLEYEKMVPVRVPPRIVRVWIAPFEDEDGDLNQGGYVFMEVSPGRWIFGEELKKTGNTISPFFRGKPGEIRQVETKDEKKDGKRDGKTVERPGTRKQTPVCTGEGCE